MKTRYAVVIIAAVSILIYANSLNNPFQYDDQIYLEENTNIKTVGLQDVFMNPSSLFAPNTTTGHYRPLVLMMHVVNYRIHGLTPQGYHVVNLAFHIGSAIMLYLIIKAMLVSSEQLAVNSKQSAVSSKQLTVNSEQLAVSSKQIADSRFKGFSDYCSLFTSHYIALASALIFAVHPFNSEVVNYITARSSVMSGFFYLLAFWCWVKFRQSAVNSKQLAVSSEQSAVSSQQIAGGSFKGFSAHCSLFTVYYIGSLLAFLLGMLSKEVVITLPIVLWLYDIYFVHPHRPPHSAFRPLFNWRTYLPYLPFVIAVAVPMMIMRVIYWGRVVPSFRRAPLVQIYTELPVIVKHLLLFIFPAGLNVDHYSEVYQSFFSWPVVLSAVILILYLMLAVAAYRARSGVWRMASFFMIWFFIVLLPTVLFPLNAIFQENRGYLALIVFAVFAGVMMVKLQAISGVVKRYVPVSVLVVIVLCYGAGTIYRNNIWGDGVSLWTDAAAKSPQSSRAYTNLGTEYAGIGSYDKALENLLKALRYSDPENKPELANIHYNLGAVYQQMGRKDMAVGEYRMVTELQPSDFRPYYNMGVLYQQGGAEEAALEAYKGALKRHPADFRSYHNIGLLYQNRGDVALAAGYYRKALSINPDYVKSRINLEAIYGQNRR